MAYDPTSTEGVPEAGTARLLQNRSGLFTSDLSVNEFLLVRQAGFQPLGLVIGSSTFWPICRNDCSIPRWATW